MYNSIVIAKNFVLQVLKNKINILVYVLLPPILAVVFMFMLSGSNTYTIPLGIKDLDQSNSSLHIIEYLKENDKYQVFDYELKDIESDIANKNIRAGIIIPNGFEQALKEGRALEVEVYAIEGIAITGWLEGFLNQKISTISSAVTSDYYEQILNQYVDKYITLQVKELSDVSNKVDASQTGFGMFIFASIFSIWGICVFAFKEKIFKTYQRIMTTPVTHFQYALGNILACMGFALSHMIISIPVIYLIFDISELIPLGKLIVLMLCLYGSAVSLGTLLVSIAKSQSGVLASYVLVLTISSMLGGCYWPIEFMPTFMQNIGKVTPQYWFNTGITNMIKNESILSNLIILLLFMGGYLLTYMMIFKFKKDNMKV